MSLTSALFLVLIGAAVLITAQRLRAVQAAERSGASEPLAGAQVSFGDRASSDHHVGDSHGHATGCDGSAAQAVQILLDITVATEATLEFEWNADGYDGGRASGFSVQKVTKFGLSLVLLGFGVFAAWKAWTATRKETPLDVPIALRSGESIAKAVRLNLDGLYRIEIAADSGLPGSKVPCLMGVSANSSECAGTAPVISADWVLSCDGCEMRRGSSKDPHMQPADERRAVRVIGEFPGESGRTYQLQVSINGDGEKLDHSHPRLRVAVSSLARTDFQSASVLVFSVSFICVMFGVILLGISLIPRSAS